MKCECKEKTALASLALLLGTFDKPDRKELAPAYHSFRTPRPKWWHIEIAG